jgi:hypothetical protein
LKGGNKKKIGFDFDGVIHTHVGPDYCENPRMPLPLLLDKKFEEIHNKIFDYHYHQYDIYIITGRAKRGPIFDYLNSCCINVEIIPRNNVLALGKDSDKVATAINLKLDEYYEDSTSEIQKFIDKKYEILAVNPNFRLFQTLPEFSGRDGAIVEIIL